MKENSEKEKILLHARERILKEGFFKITMDEIATGLRISKKTIYKYYRSKDELINDVINEHKRFVETTIFTIFNSELSSVEKLFQMVRFFSQLALRVGENLLNDMRLHKPELWKEIDEFRKNIILANISRLIEQGKKEGMIVEQPTEILVAIYISAITGVVNPEFIMNNKFSIQQAFNSVFEILMSGIFTPQGNKLYKKSNR